MDKIEHAAERLGRTRTARLWVYGRDDWQFAGSGPAAVFYRYAPYRKGEHSRAHLRGYRGILKADGYAALYGDGRVIEAACQVHARRKFWDVHDASKPPFASGAEPHRSALSDRGRDPRPAARSALGGLILSVSAI